VTRHATNGAAPGSARGGASSSRVTSGGALVLRSGALGDFVLTCPVFSALRAREPRGETVYIGRDSFGELLLLAGLADRVVSQDSPEVVALHSQAPDAGVALGRALGVSGLAISYLGSDDVARNLLRSGVGEVITCPARPTGGGRVHAADHLASALMGRIDVPLPACPRIDVPKAVQDDARAALLESGAALDGYVILQPGSGSPRKNWPPSCFHELAPLAKNATGLAVVVVLGPAELERGDAGADDLLSVADAVFEAPRLPLLAGLLAGAAAHVGNDSGVSHLAAACGAPTVAVFGPTDPAVWAPRGPSVRVLRDESGSPEEVAVEDVLEALVNVLRTHA